MRYSVYEKLMSEFTSITLLLAKERELQEVYEWNGTYVGKGKDLERSKFLYLDSLLGLFERVWIAHRKMRWWEKEWEPWRNWIAALAKNRIFLDVVDEAHALQVYDCEFIAEVQKIVKAACAQQKEETRQPPKQKKTEPL
jgi:hypothetical protein